MNARKKQPPATKPTPLTLSVPSPLSISFDPNASLKVAVVPPDKVPVKIGLRLATLLAIFAPLVALWSLLFYSHVVERRYSPHPIPLGGTPLSVTLAYPARAALGDENELDLIVTNFGNDSFTGNLVVSLAGAHLRLSLVSNSAWQEALIFL